MNFTLEKMDEFETCWVLLEEGYPHTIGLTKKQAEAHRDLHKRCFPDLEYTIFYDEYYEFTEITKTE